MIFETKHPLKVDVIEKLVFLSHQLLFKHFLIQKFKILFDIDLENLFYKSNKLQFT